MKIEVAVHARMSERGSSLLRLIQNNNMPILDLFVRESIQNSLDAGLEGSGPVHIDINVREFYSTRLNRHFEGIQHNLNRKYPEGKYKLLEIRDSNTTGLTGPLCQQNVKGNNFGNILKLVYEISMPQQKEGAGGSWGLGKTVYFRMGIGLVIYYSRVKLEDGTFQSRLAACLVEDETREDALLNNYTDKHRRGIAWWGREIGQNETVPVTDNSEIELLLSDLNIRPYEGTETGTTIIIPYISESALLEGILPAGESIIKPWWISTVENYLKVAVQRWYAPRLNNESYPYGRWLTVRVNGKTISIHNMLPLFRVIRSLYMKTPISGKDARNNDILEGAEVYSERVNLRNILALYQT